MSLTYLFSERENFHVLSRQLYWLKQGSSSIWGLPKYSQKTKLNSSILIINKKKKRGGQIHLLAFTNLKQQPFSLQLRQCDSKPIRANNDIGENSLHHLKFWTLYRHFYNGSYHNFLSNDLILSCLVCNHSSATLSLLSC